MDPPQAKQADEDYGGPILLKDRLRGDALFLNITRLEKVLAAGDFDVLDADLLAFIDQADGDGLAEDEDGGTRHPLLVFPVRKERLMQNILDGDKLEAINFYNARIAPLGAAGGMHVPFNGHLRTQVENVRDSVLNEDGSSRLWPTNQEAIMNKVLDYIRLYFPGFVRYSMRILHHKQPPMWDLSMILTNEDGAPLTTNSGKIRYRCLACGHWEKGSGKGIQQLQYHLNLSQAGRADPCEMSTPRLFQLMELPLTMPVPAAGNIAELLLPDPDPEESYGVLPSADDTQDKSSDDNEDSDHARMDKEHHLIMPTADPEERLMMPDGLHAVAMTSHKGTGVSEKNAVATTPSAKGAECSEKNDQTHGTVKVDVILVALEKITTAIDCMHEKLKEIERDVAELKKHCSK